VRIAIAFILLLSLGNGCVTPNIPLPPPPLDTLSFKVIDPAQDQVVIRGSANPTYRGYLVFFYNLRSGEGVISQADPADGSFETNPIKVQDQDQLEFWAARRQEDTPSDVACVQLDVPQGGMTTCH
jgi:hypothetical protein